MKVEIGKRLAAIKLEKRLAKIPDTILDTFFRKLILNWYLIEEVAELYYELLTKFDLTEYYRGGYSKIPKASLNVCYGGSGYKGSRKEKEEEILYAPLAFESNGNEFKNFTAKDLKELLDYASGTSVAFPKCLLPDSFEAELEERIKYIHAKEKFSVGDIISDLNALWEKAYSNASGGRLFLIFWYNKTRCTQVVFMEHRRWKTLEKYFPG